MNCIVCDEAADFNRAVIERDTGEEVGDLCGDCERAVFGELFDEYARDGDACVVCGAEGRYVFPEWWTDEDDEEVHSVIMYDADSLAPVLCTAHFQGLRSRSTGGADGGGPPP